MQGQNSVQRVNKPSLLLSPEENEFVYSLLGPKCLTISTAVVQLYTSQAPAHRAWFQRQSGIACFVRDSTNRSYYIRIYCAMNQELIWEEEMYRSIEIFNERKFFITFEGKDCIVALSFANESEANHFYVTISSTIASRSGRDRRNKQGKNDDELLYESSPILRNDPNSMTTEQLQQRPTPPPPLKKTKGKKKKGDEKKKRGLTKADISNPTNFSHVAHMGYDSPMNTNMDDELNKMEPYLRSLGVSDRDLNNRKTREFIYDFIATHQEDELNSAQSEQPQNNSNQRRALPPIPDQNGHNIMHEPSQRSSPTANIDPNIQRQRAIKRALPLPPPPLPPQSTKLTSSRSPPPPPPLSTLPRSAKKNVQQEQQNRSAEPPSLRSAPSTAAPPVPPPSVRRPMPQIPAPPIASVAPVAAIAPVAPVVSVTPIAPIAPPPPPIPPSDFFDSDTAPAPNDPRAALMGSIRDGMQLRPVVKDLEDHTDNCGRDALLESIRSGIKLKPAIERTMPESSMQNTCKPASNNIADALKKALLLRNAAVQSSEDEDESSSEEDWD